MVRPVKNIIVHVGDIKSATTSVQVTLAADRQPEYSGSLLYPVRGLNHNYLMPAMKSGEGADHPQISWLRKKIISAKNIDTCIISGERLSVLPPRQLKEALDRAFADLAERMTIVHYVRPQFDRLLSGYAERIKIGAEQRPLKEALQEAIATGRFLQSQRLQRWGKVFGDSYKLRAMVPSRLERGDPVVDFFHTAFGYVPNSWQAPVPSNESLSAPGLAQVFRLQKSLSDIPAQLRHALGYEFAGIYASADDAARSQRIGIDNDMKSLVRDAFLADAQFLDQSVFGGNDIFVPALLTGIEKASSGHSQPLDLPIDPAGQRISEQLLDMVKRSRDYSKLARNLRNARYDRYIKMAKIT